MLSELCALEEHHSTPALWLQECLTCWSQPTTTGPHTPNQHDNLECWEDSIGPVSNVWKRRANTHRSRKILYSSTWTASRFVSYFSFLQPWPIQHMVFSCKKKDYRSSGHTSKCINCHYLKLQRNFYTFVELKLQKTNCFNISNEIFERTTFFLLV